MGTATTVFLKKLELVYEPRFPPFLVGPCTLLVYYGGTVATVGSFAQVSWVEGKVADFYQK